MEKTNVKLCMGCMSPIEQHTQPCAHCGHRLDSPYNVDYLAPGTVLQSRYLVGKLTSHNCESAVYIGFDTKAEAKVWVREFAPSATTHRSHSDQSLLINENCEKSFESSLLDFEELAQTLAKASANEPVVPVIEVFKANNTIYIIFKYAQMLTLGELLSRSGGTLSWQASKKLFMPLFTGISHLHSRGVIHGGICPENILVDTAGKLWLWGFATQALRCCTQECKTGELYIGYSAPEQYSAEGWHGSWTDVYGAGAVLYRALTGTMPIEAAARAHQDNLTPAAELDSSIPENVSDALSAAMVLTPENRTQTIDELTANLLESSDSNTAVFIAGDNPPKKQKNTKMRLSPTFAYLLAAMGVTLVLIGSVLFYLMNNVFSDLLAPPEPLETSSVSEEPSSAVPVRVPSFIGLYIETVKKNSTWEQDFDIVILESYNEEYPVGVVFDQTPSENNTFTSRGTVTLYVSKGSESVKMPNLVGSNLEFAMDTLTRMGVKFDIIEVPDEEADPNIILRTDKEVGTDVRKHRDTVTLFIKEGSGITE